MQSAPARRIRVLPDTLANQIAAGEVVERPASVIKELIENSIDAGASRVQVDIELGGRRLMRVSDDGGGMHRDDAVLAFERHATSKISVLEDLGRIITLGFRGEALASIASVAKVELVTKTADDLAATRVVIEGGRLIDVKDAARSDGTTVAVRDLFFNTPARRKFMRSEATENYHLSNIVTHYSLAHPEIAFGLTINGRETLRVSPAKELRERAFQIFGDNLLESLLPVSGGREFVASVSGFVSAPRERRTTRDGQYFFVNQRFVRDKTIAGGLLEGYRSVLPHGVYPVAFLFVNVPVEEIDVNVHPAKTEIRFRRTEAVKDVIAETVRASLARAGIVAENDSASGGVEFRTSIFTENGPSSFAEETRPAITEILSHPPAEAGAKAETKLPRGSSANEKVGIQAQPLELLELASQEFESAAAVRSESTVEGSNGRDANFEKAVDFAALQKLPPINTAEHLVTPAEVDTISSSRVTPIAQLHNSFIIAVDDEGLLLVDQHVAHERILFDKYKKREVERPIESQNLLMPETFDLSPAQAEAFGLIETELAGLGFNVMRLSGRTVAIKSIPTDLPAADTRNLFAEILDAIGKDGRGGAKNAIRDNIAASLACRAAVKVNMKLTAEKMQWLIDRLLLTSSPTTCPHGRPVILRLSMKAIERGFHRT
ncbi:MAG: DNA mismatch repair endonuclease MutL, partial [Pyrinomonadaceae bacterium]